MTVWQPANGSAHEPVPISPAPWDGRRAFTPLPIPRTSLIGRADEIATVSALLSPAGSRLVTITGPGGVGKTRVAIQAATESAETFSHGVAFAALGALRDPDLVAPTIAQALGVRETGDAPLPARLAAFLRPRHLLLVLDNLEHLVAAAPLIADLVSRCPTLVVLATSRVRLHLSGEREVVVPPLRVWDGNARTASAATQLFIERASAARPGFSPGADTADIAAICARLDGLPLAIEMAAARARILAPKEILARLERHMPVLAPNAGDAPARQRTMRDTIAWSHDLLSPAGRALFRRLAVFTGGFTLDAATRVAILPGDAAGDVLDGIAELIDQSLLQRTEGPDGKSRFSMLETVRDDARERLAASGEAETIRCQHAQWVVGLAEGGRASDLGAWRERLAADQDNLRAALAWAIDRGDADTAQRIVAATWHQFFLVRGQLREARAWTDRALALGRASDPRILARVRSGASTLAGYGGDHDDAVMIARQSLADARDTGDDVAVGRALFGYAHATGKRDGPQTAIPILEEVLTLLQPAPGDDELAIVAMTFHNLAVATATAGDDERSESLAAHALAVWERLRHVSGTAATLDTLADLARQHGDRTRAATLAQRALALRWEVQDRFYLIDSLALLAEIVAHGAPLLGARLWGVAESLGEQVGLVVSGEFEDDQRERMARVAGITGREAFARGRLDGRSWPLDDAVAAALAFDPAGAAGTGNGDRSMTSEPILTGREMDVLRLINEGSTDREIAEALYISHRTVNVHVGHILAKLDVQTRRDAVRLARAAGLLTAWRVDATEAPIDSKYA